MLNHMLDDNHPKKAIGKRQVFRAGNLQQGMGSHRLRLYQRPMVHIHCGGA